MICFRVNRVIPFLLLALFAGISLGSFAQSTIVLETKDKTVQAVKNSFPNFEVSRDGKLIAVTSSVSRIGENRVGGILIFNTVNFKLLRVLRGHETVIINMKFSPDGSKLLASEFNKNVVLWDVKTGKVIKKIALGKAALFFDINSRNQALFANFGRSISLYDLNTGQQIHNFKLKSSFVTNLLFTDDDKAKIVTNKQFHEYNITTREFVDKVDLLEKTDAVWYSNSISDIGNGSNSYYFATTKYFREGMKTGLIGNIIISELLNGRFGTQTEHLFDQEFRPKGVLGHPSLDEIYVISNNELRVYDKSWSLLYQEDVSRNASRISQNSLAKITHFNHGKHLAITDLLSLTRIYSVEQRKIIAYLYVTTNDEYAVISPNGNMDGDIEAIDDLQWSDGMNTIGLENTFEAMYSPNLLARLLAGEVAVQSVNLQKALSGKPEVKIVSVDENTFNNDSLALKKRNISIEIEAWGGDELSEIRLYHNRKLTGISREFDEGATVNRVSFDVSLTNVYGAENFFFAKAVNREGIESDAAKLVINYLNDEKAKPRLYLLSVGVNQYKNPKYNLNYARPDAEAFTEMIRQHAASLFEEVNITTLNDSDATRENLIGAFNQIKSSSNEQDLFMFYYAGHGVMSSGDMGKPMFYMVLPAVTKLYGSDQMLSELAISADEIKQFSQEINAQKQVYFVDACQSGGALETFASRGMAEERAIANLARSTGTFWVSATGSEQFATEFEALGHGVFTYVILEGLSGAANAGGLDRNITIRELNAFIENRVPILSEEHKGTPQFPASYGYGNDFPILLLKEN